LTRIAQIRGMLLEEVILYLLRVSGYRTVEDPDNDPTLRNGPAGLEVIGRGSAHQIDAVADFRIPHPFTNPQRLLVEAKCYDRNPAELSVVRNAVGVLKDVSEFWFSPPRTIRSPPTGMQHLGIARSRYHYCYAIFSATGFSRRAQHYAYAQDVSLLPLDRSRFVRPIIDAIRSIGAEDFRVASGREIQMPLSDLRRNVREAIRRGRVRCNWEMPEAARSKIERILGLIYETGGAILAMLAGCFPVFLVPENVSDITQLEEDRYTARIRRHEESWYLEAIRRERNLRFSFGLPDELFNLYADHGVLSRSRALDLKARHLARIDVFLCQRERVRLVTFELDEEWLRMMRERTEPCRSRGGPRKRDSFGMLDRREWQ